MRTALPQYFKALLLGLIVLTLASISIAVHASPVNPGWRTYTQPDGSKFTGQAFGDEHFSWIETADGRPVVGNRVSKWFEYATVQSQNGRTILQSSGLAARAGHDARTLSATLPAINRDALVAMWKQAHRHGPQFHQGPQYSPTPATTSGTTSPARTVAARTAYTIPSPTRNLLLILVNFTDTKIRSTDLNWSNKFFPATAGTVNDYFSQATLGKLQFVKAPENYGTANDGVVKVELNYAHPNKGNTDNLGFKKVLDDALAAANTSVDYKQFDTNTDGYIQTAELQIMFVIAGYESAFDGIQTRGISAHAWDFQPSETGAYDGVFYGIAGQGNYALIGEWHGDHEATIGVAAHELGHAALKLPDLKDGNHMHFVSNWCLMGSGGWAMRSGEPGGKTPALMSAYARVLGGVITPTVVTAGATAQNVILKSAEKTTYNVVKIPTAVANEYFLVEVRRDAGYDQGFRGAIANFAAGSYGLSIWHVPAPDANDAVWPYLVSANNMNGGTAPTEPLNRLAMFYSGNKTVFGTSTTPNSNTFSGQKTNIVLQNIALSGEDMTMQVSAFACATYSAFNSTHVTAGRARKVVSGFTTTYYANGSNVSLGTSAYTTNVLAQTSTGYYVKGSCL